MQLLQLVAPADAAGREWRRATALGRLAISLLVLLLLATGTIASQDADIDASRQARLSLLPRNIHFSHITSADGLSQNSVNSIVQDRQGYIWIGTQEGLNRYDGYDLVVFEHDPEDPGSLSHNWVWSLLVDRSGTLWVGTDGGGLSRYDPITESFEHFRHDPANPQSISSNRVRVIYEDREGDIWIGTDGGGLNRFDRKAAGFHRFGQDPRDPGSLGNDTVLSLLQDERGTLWIGTDGGGLAALDPQRRTFRHFRHNPNVANSLSHDRVRSLYQDRNGLLWIGTYEGGLNLLDPISGTVRIFQYDPMDPHSLSNDWVRHVIEDADGTLWVATDGGLNEWRPDAGQFVRYQQDRGKRHSLSNDRVTTIFQDRGGVLWVGTYSGVNKWNYVSDAFRTISDRPGEWPRLSGSVVTALDESPQGHIWLGTYGAGLNRVDPTTGTVSVYRHRADDPDSLADNRVMALFVDQEGIVWIGTRSKGLAKLNPEDGHLERFVHDPNDSNSLSSNAVTCIFGDPDGVLWVGTYGGGLHRLDPRTGKFSHYRHDPEASSTLSSDRVLVLLRDSRGDLWVGTEDAGLNRLDETTQSFARFRNEPNRQDSLSSDKAWELMEGRDGSLWVGTMDGGLNRWAPEDRANGRARFTRYRKSHGLVSDTVFGILQADDGALWLSSNRGLSRFDPDTGDVRQFDENHGLPRGEFNFGSRLRSRAGLMYLGSTDGLVAFNPDALRRNLHPPTVAVRARTLLETLASAYSAGQPPAAVELGYADSFIAFDFAGLDFSSPDKNQYRYKLDGFDGEWMDPGKFRRATYTNLPAGSYTFRVMASNDEGVWSEDTADVPLRVVPAPWRTPWAYVLCAGLLIAFSSSFLYRQRKRLERETKQRLEMEHQVRIRTRELAERNSDLVKLNAKLEWASVTDSLTELPNRRFLYDLLENDSAHSDWRPDALIRPPDDSHRVDISPGLFFMMVDLDGFKLINDTYGHHAGDLALKQVRDLLLSCCGSSERVIRWGGDEFLVLGRPGNRAGAEKLAERIRAKLAGHQYRLGGGHVGRLSGSIGFASHPFVLARSDLLSWEQVMTIADQASYIAKNSQRNAWVGIYCAKRSAPQDLPGKIKADLAGQVALDNIRITTSIQGPLHLHDRRKVQQS